MERIFSQLQKAAGTCWNQEPSSRKMQASQTKKKEAVMMIIIF